MFRADEEQTAFECACNVALLMYLRQLLRREVFSFLILHRGSEITITRIEVNCDCELMPRDLKSFAVDGLKDAPDTLRRSLNLQLRMVQIAFLLRASLMTH